MLSSANYKQYKELQSFQSVDEMNETIRSFLYKHTHELSESAINVLKYLARHSCKIPGVSFLKVATIATALGISARTVQRVLKILEDFEVLARHKTIRKEGKLRGGNGHNVYVLLKNYSVIPNVPAEMSQGESAENPINSKVSDTKLDKEAEFSESHPLEEFKNELNVKETSPRESKKIELEELDETFTPENVPNQFRDTVAPYFRSANKIYKLYHRVLIAYKRSKIDKPIEHVIDRAIQAFKETVFAQKSNKIKNTFEGYFYRVLESKLTVERRRECKGTLYDWLNV
ncbi:helix-turn-helix domain-containing protein [Bacillus sp. IBL03825]|uniref:helix-turn-helix domain-containing protein n=1 Tax=Bacillus sp. IBL03825 TaxID=2953580 RepID=UPI00215792D9|nr:helix-turn-helix domain-containing protein [Bacillus sp. IBL03825]MCR6846288.1 helix-turn-helix domain-containing protein [Bacillus sp. IBL03825]